MEKRTLTLADIKDLITKEVSKAVAGCGVQIDYLETKVEELKETNKEYLDRIIDLERKVEELETRVGELEDRIEDTPDQYDLDRLEERVDDLESWSEEIPTSRDLEELESRLPTTEDLRDEIDTYFKENIDLGEYISDHLSVNVDLSWN